jgi:PQQ-dependent dehydrogenase (methanol/ethanol family)
MKNFFAPMALGLLLSVSSLTAMAQDSAFVPVSVEELEAPKAEDWLMFRGSLNGWNHSPLNQINRDNVSSMQLAWVAPMEAGTIESSPLVRDGIMYMINPGSVIQALDASTGDLIWEYRRQLPEGVSTTGVVRNIAIYEDSIFHSTPDGYLIAVNATTGQLEWETVVGDHTQSFSASSGPIVVKGKVISPHTCSRTGNVVPGGCFITGHDAATGEELWRTHSIARPGEFGDDSWNGMPLETRFHASPWMPGVYDPELDLLFWGTGVPAPHARVLRPEGDGDLLYTDSTLAMNPDTGEIVWYFQYTPNDNWDLDAVFDRFIVETEVSPNADEVRWINPDITPGEKRRVLTGAPDKTGMIYTLDAATGQFLWAREQTFQNIKTDLDLSTGRPVYNEETIHTELDQTLLLCPHVGGGRNWPAGTYSPSTNAMYTPLNNTCTEATPYADERIPGGGQYRWPAVHVPGGNNMLGRIQAVSAETGETLWNWEQEVALGGGILSTGGGLVFGGDINRRLRAFDDATGEILWETILGGPISGHPISYSANGKQYVSVQIGGGTLQEGNFGPLTPEVKIRRGGNAVYTFTVN